MTTTPQPALSTSGSAKNPPVIPSEVGWQFVPQYYTHVNKYPHRLHCFYTKNSTFIHGTEGEDIKPSYGQQEIHNKILSLNYVNCKVYIHSVDAQSSANNGIIIQVIGEMSNAGEAWRKFVQTFFLAEQPNGYFVLNDIFRYLKEDSLGDDDDEVEAVEDNVDQSAEEHEAPLETHVAEPPSPPQIHYQQPVEPTPIAPEPPVPVALTPEPIARTPSPLPAEPSAPVSTNGVNGTSSVAESVNEERQPVPAPVEASPVPEPAAVEPTPEPTPVVVPPAAVPPPAVSAPAAVAPPPPSAAPPPSGPKTWATLAASNSRQWGKQVAPEAKGISAAAPPAAIPPPAPPVSQPHRGQNGKADGHPALRAAMELNTPQCFVKGVTENIQQKALTDLLTNRFGPLKDIEIIRNKACAFLEFNTVESARKAIIASLPINQGGEGGIRIEVEGHTGLPPRITVEIRKERGDRPPPRPRGGAPGGAPGSHPGPQQPINGGHDGGAPSGRGQGGRGRGQMRGRGAPPQKA